MIRTAIRGFGEVLITLGLVVLLFAAYEVYGKALQANAEQNRLGSALEDQWNAPVAPGTKPVADKPIPGAGVARLYIPRLGKDWVVVEGVAPKDIKLAPGRYPKSQLPGQVGNFAVAGHRMPSIFWDLDKVKVNDPMIAETRTGWYVYTVSKVFIVKPTRTSVVAANPDDPGSPATRKLLTLTTCNPKWDNYERLVVQAEMVREQPKSAGRPAELGE
ncbi:MAG TPA: class E sortase [Gemmatimonadales bacterium]